MGDLPASWSCTSCGAAIPTDHPYTWCAACGEPLPSEVAAHLRNLYTGTAPSGPATPDSGQWLATSAATFDEAYAALLNPPRARSGALLLVGTMGAFVVVEALRDGDWWWAGLLVVVLLLHESGHFAGMRWFGYQDVRMFFIPLLGAAVSGRPTGTAAWKDGVVTLLGPLPGILLGLGFAIAIAASNAGQAWFWSLAWLLVLLNAFNLLPLGPLDGGRLFQSVLFSRHIALEIAGGVLAVVGLVVLAIAMRAGILMVIAIWALFHLRVRYRAASAAGWLRRQHADLPGDPAALNPDQRFALFTAARTIIPDQSMDHAPTVAGAMNAILESFRPRPSAVASLLLLGAWAGGMAVAILAAFVLVVVQPPSWARHECDDLHVSAEFPSVPVQLPAITLETPLGQRDARGCGAPIRGAVYSIVRLEAGVTLDESQQKIWLDGMNDAPHTVTPVFADGLPAAEVTYESPEEGRHRMVFAGSTIFRVSAFGGTPEDVRRFLESFRLRR